MKKNEEKQITIEMFVAQLIGGKPSDYKVSSDTNR